MNGFVSEDKGIGYPQEWTVVKQVQHHRALTLTMVMRGGDAFTRLCVTHQEGTHQLQPLDLRCANFNNHETSPTVFTLETTQSEALCDRHTK